MKPASIRARGIRTWLGVESLEDRTTPTAVLTENLTAFAGDRVLVTVESPAGAGVLTASPLAHSVQRLGGNAYVVTLNGGVSVGQAVAAFDATAGVAFAEPDYAIGGQVTPNDPGFSQDWGLNNTRQTGGTADADIDAPEAWDTAHGTGQHIVAIIDTGVQYTHPDLAANMWRNPGEIAGDGIDNDHDGIVDDVFGANYSGTTVSGNPLDDNGHGTHVAGTIGAVGNNGIGVAGVAWTTKIMALKFLGSNGSGSTSGAVSAIYYAVDHGATILSNSWGGGGYSQSLYDAISYANQHGVIFVAAAGNNASNNDTTANYPSNYALPNVVAVASTTSTDGLSSFSNYGANSVTLGAPGSSIYSTYLGSTYATLSGTSMATPHVSGALAVAWDADPTLTAAQLIQRLKSSVDVIPALVGKTSTGGRLNLKNMLGGTSPPPPPPASGPKVVASAFSGTQANTFDKVRLTFDKAISASTFTTADVAALAGPGGSLAVSGVTAVAGSNGTQFDVTFVQAQAAFGAYSITVGPNINDTTGLPMNQDGDGINGEATQDRYTGSATLSPPYQAFDYSYTLPAAIRDLTTLNAYLTIPTVAGKTTVPFSDLNVTVRLTHTWDSDLRITLFAPNGKSAILFNRRGGSGDNLTNTFFNDEATVAISAGAAPFTGSFKPEQVLSLLDGQNAAGTWRLEIADLAGGDSGTLQSFTLGFTTGTPPAGQSVQMLAFREGDESAGIAIKPDSAAPAVVETFAQPASPTVVVTAPVAVPPTVATSPTSVPGSPGTLPAAPTVVPLPTSGSPFAPATSALQPPTDPVAPVVAPPTLTSPVVALPDKVPSGTVRIASQLDSVDLLSFLGLFHKDDAFASFRL